jgi:hypothetical protein
MLDSSQTDWVWKGDVAEVFLGRMLRGAALASNLIVSLRHAPLLLTAGLF